MVSLSGIFGAGDDGAMMDVYIQHNGATIWSAMDLASDQSFSIDLAVSAGDVIDWLVTGGWCCGNTPIDIKIDPAVPVIVRQPQSQIGVCRGEVVFSVAAQSGLAVTYQWYKNDNAIAGARSETLVLKNLSLNDAGSYSVEVSNAQGSVRSRAATLGVSAAGTSIQLYAGVTIEGIVGKTYTIQYTTNLNQPTWVTLTTITLTQPVQLWYDSEPAIRSARYYRVDGPCE